MPRRTVFVATVNQANFLVDDTGNSRWWVIPVTKVDYLHDIDMQQLFAQLKVEFEAGGQWWLTPDEERLLDEQNRHNRTISVIEDELLRLLHMDKIGADGLKAFTALEVLGLIGVEKPTNPQCKECAGILRTYLGEPKRIQGRDKWRVPFRLNGTGQVIPPIDFDDYD